MFNPIKIQIDGFKTVVKPGVSILEVTKLLGIQVPRFCYYQGLSISGNCRMCLVELKNVEKLVLSCSTRVEPNIEIVTNSLDVKKARENILELLLINHPLDCPICDQGGECDLQENTLGFGSFSSKINKTRRGVEDSGFNFLIKTVMTRCIHCTRCIRFADEIANSPTLGTLSRGDKTEVGGYSKKSFHSEISGNVVDLCPVGSIVTKKKYSLKKDYCGALTNRREAFKTRPWEFKALETIDLTDSLSPTILVNVNETEILRVLPKNDTFTTYNLISNRARFSYDSLKNNRLYDILALPKSNYAHKNLIQILKLLAAFVVLNKNLVLIVNPQLHLVVFNKLKFLSYLQKNVKLVNPASFNSFINVCYYFYNSLIKFSNQTSSFFLIGLDLNFDIPVLGTKIKTIASTMSTNLYSVGNKNLISSSNQFFNLNVIDFLKIYEGKKKVFSNLLAKTYSQVFVGESFQKRCNSSDISFYLNNKNSYNIAVCHTEVNLESCNLLNLKSSSQKDFNENALIFFIDICDNILSRKTFKSTKKAKIWFTSHFDSIYEQSFLMIPIMSNYFEQSGVYINLEKVPQMSLKVLNTLSDSKSILSIINFVLPVFNKEFSYFFFINESLKKTNQLFNKFTDFFGYKKLLITPKCTVVSKYIFKINEKASVDTFQKNSYNFNTFLLRQRS